MGTRRVAWSGVQRPKPFSHPTQELRPTLLEALFKGAAVAVGSRGPQRARLSRHSLRVCSVALSLTPFGLSLFRTKEYVGEGIVHHASHHISSQLFHACLSLAVPSRSLSLFQKVRIRCRREEYMVLCGPSTYQAVWGQQTFFVAHRLTKPFGANKHSPSPSCVAFPHLH